LEYLDGDRSLKNYSRIMRLAGSWYMKGDAPGTTAAKIAVNSGERYSYEHLRELVPTQQKNPELLPLESQERSSRSNGAASQY